jgi:hypothetical protein
MAPCQSSKGNETGTQIIRRAEDKKVQRLLEILAKKWHKPVRLEHHRSGSPSERQKLPPASLLRSSV